MGDDDELRVDLEVLEQPDEAPDVVLVERRVHLVEHAERARLDQVDPEEERQRRQRPLSPRQEVDALGLLAPRRRVDLDRGLEGVFGVLEPDVGLPALEEPQEGRPKVGADLVEGSRKEVRRRLVDLADRRAEVVAGPGEIGPLRRQELEALALLGVLLHREHVHGPEPFESSHQVVQLRLQLLRLSLHRAGLVEQDLERPAPLALQALTDPLDPALQLLLLELQRVAAVHRGALGGPSLPRPPLGNGERFPNLLQELVPGPYVRLGPRPLLEEPGRSLVSLEADASGLRELVAQPRLLRVQRIDSVVRLPARRRDGLEPLAEAGEVALQAGDVDGQASLLGVRGLPFLLHGLHGGAGRDALVLDSGLLPQQGGSVPTRDLGAVRGPRAGRLRPLELTREVVPDPVEASPAIRLRRELGADPTELVLGFPLSAPGFVQGLLRGLERLIRRTRGRTRPRLAGDRGFVLVRQPAQLLLPLEQPRSAPGVAHADHAVGFGHGDRPGRRVRQLDAVQQSPGPRGAGTIEGEVAEKAAGGR